MAKQTWNGTVSAFNNAGYNWINSGNIKSVVGFLEDMRAAGADALYSSKFLLTRLEEMYEDTALLYGEEETGAAFTRAAKRGLTPEQLAGNVQEWISHAEEVAEGRRSGKLRVYSKYADSEFFSHG